MSALPLFQKSEGRAARPAAISLAKLGALISGLLIFCGLLFRTYTISMPSQGMEALRQFGVPFVFAEVIVIFWAARRGFHIQDWWNKLPISAKWLGSLFLCTFWVGSVFASEVRPLGIIQNLFLLIHIAFACAIVETIGEFSFIDLNKMAKNLALGLFAFCILTAFAFVFHPPLNSMPNNEIIWQFAIPGFISLRLFGAFCGAIFCFLLGVYLLEDESKKLSPWHILWCTISAGMMIWSGTRGAVLSSMGAMTIAFVVYHVRPSLRASLSLIALLVVASIAAMALVPKGDILFLLYTPGDVASADAATGGRLEYWFAVWQAYLKVPIFGAGPFATRFLLNAGEVAHVQPHNIVLQFLITWGGVASIAAFVLLGMATLKAHIITWHHRITLPFLMMLDCLLLMSLLDGMAHFAQHLMLIMICYGAIFGYQRAVQTGDPQPQVA